MRRRPPTIAALGGGGFWMEPDNPLLDDWLSSLTGVPEPSVCFVPTACGDRAERIAAFEGAFAGRARPSVLRLFAREIDDLRAFVLSRDLIYVGGGNTANMLAIWRVHGLDAILREAWAAGVVLAGLSAGSLCWYEAGVTDSFGKGLGPLRDGLGLVAGSHCPHYDGEARRRPVYRRLVAEGALPPGLALDDGVAALYRGLDARRVELVSSRPTARAAWITADGEAPLPVRYLGGRST